MGTVSRAKFAGAAWPSGKIGSNDGKILKRAKPAANNRNMTSPFKKFLTKTTYKTAPNKTGMMVDNTTAKGNPLGKPEIFNQNSKLKSQAIFIPAAMSEPRMAALKVFLYVAMDSFIMLQF